MKVTGPGAGAPPEGPGGAEGVDKAAPLSKGGAADETAKTDASGRSFAETLASGRAPTSSNVKGAGAVDPLTADIAADLKAGKIDPKAALDRVVERVLDQQLGKDAPSALRAQLRDALRDTISSDPMLTELLRAGELAPPRAPSEHP